MARVPPSRVVLVTDFDGTLAEVVSDPKQSAALPEALASLRRLAGALAQVIVLSSRSLEQLDTLVPVPGLRLIGDSGLPPPSDRELAALARFNSEVPALLKGAPGTWLEAKPASSSVHFRASALKPEDVRSLLRPVLAGTNLVAAAGRRVIEVHAPHAGKGATVAKLLAGLDAGGAVCMGDDENDRSMFEYVSSLETPHLCVGVSSVEAPPDLFERCDIVVSGPPSAAALLGEMAHWAETGRGA